MITALTVAYLLCFQCAAWPAIARIIRRGSSADLSVWREWLVLAGVVAQFAVFYLTGSGWEVLISPLVSGATLVAMLAVIYWHR